MCVCVCTVYLCVCVLCVCVRAHAHVSYAIGLTSSSISNILKLLLQSDCKYLTSDMGCRLEGVRKLCFCIYKTRKKHLSSANHCNE